MGSPGRDCPGKRGLLYPIPQRRPAPRLGPAQLRLDTVQIRDKVCRVPTLHNELADNLPGILFPLANHAPEHTLGHVRRQGRFVGNGLHGGAERRAFGMHFLGSQDLLVVATDVVDGGDAVAVVFFRGLGSG